MNTFPCLLVLAIYGLSSNAVAGFQVTPPSLSCNSQSHHKTKLYLPKHSKHRHDPFLHLHTAKQDDFYMSANDAAMATPKGGTVDSVRLADAVASTNADDAKFSETLERSLAKAMSWRAIAGSVTFVTSLSFSGSISTALSIVGSDFFSKAATMFIGERLMNKSQAGRMGGADDVRRSLAKALVWRLFAICNTLAMSWVIAKDLSLASKIASSDALFKTGLMFWYERMWAKVEWGKDYLVFVQ